MERNNNKTLNQVVLIGLLIAMDVVLTRFLSIQLPTARIGFGFLPVAICGLMFGPVAAATSGILGDLIGYFLWPSGGGYFIGFTISASLRGLIFGYMLKTKGTSKKNIVIAALICAVGITMILDTYWLSILIGKSYLVMLPTRALQAVYTFVVQVALITTVSSVLNRHKFLENN